MSAKPQIIRVNPDTPSFLDRYEDVKIARGRLLAHQRVKIPPNELLAVKQAVKASRRRRRKGKNLRGEVKEIKTQQRRFEKGERRDRDEEEPRIVGDPKPGLNFDPELEKEKWGGDMTQVNAMVDEALEEYTKVLKQLESEV